MAAATINGASPSSTSAPTSTVAPTVVAVGDKSDEVSGVSGLLSVDKRSVVRTSSNRYSSRMGDILLMKDYFLRYWIGVLVRSTSVFGGAVGNLTNMSSAGKEKEKKLGHRRVQGDEVSEEGNLFFF